ncbi:MAG: pitrilysin family protein [Candidatus Dadabacteria bacterium]|nr:pitrilysin family protein [Candidatus Dadabacteria bacterium]
MRARAFLLFLCAVFYAGGSELSAKEISSVTKTRLDNGLTVLLEPDASAPVTAVNVWVKTGSGCERDGERGLAHFHEHMLFKGGGDMGPGELAFEVESSGGRINAFTSFDHTVYHIVSASRSAGRSIDLLASSVTAPAFDPEELKKEIEVVVEEIRRDKDNPSSVMSRRLFETAYEGHPYGLPILGTRESVRSFTREKVSAFYRKWYTPRNMVVVVTGDFKPGSVLARIKKRFGSLKKSPAAVCAEATAPPVRKSPAVSVQKRDTNEGYFSLAFRIPGVAHEDVPALDVISEIMGAGDSSRLHRIVKEEKGIVNTVYSYAYAPVMGGVFAVGGTVAPDGAEAAYGEILPMLYGLADTSPAPSEIQKAKVNIESDSVRSRETMQGRAHSLGFYETAAGDYGFEGAYVEAVRAVTAADIRRVAAKYFTPANLSVSAVVPPASRSSAQSVKEAVSGAKPPSPDSGKGGKTNIHKLKNGIKVIIKENKSVPLFSVRLLFPGGLRFEDARSGGLSNLTANMLTRGTHSRTAKQIAEEMESLAGYIEGFSGRDSAGVVMEALSANFDTAMDIFADVALNPSFEPEEMARAKREISAAISKKKDDLAAVGIRRFLAALFKGGAYSRDILGTEAGLKRFSRAAVAEFHRKALNPREMIIVVVGDVSAKKALRRLEKDFSRLAPAPRLRPQSSRVKQTRKPLVTVKNEPEKQQTHIIAGFGAPKIGSPDYYPFQVLNSILSGQGGRLFLKLRDEMSLAYSVTSFYGARVDAGYFGVYIGTAPGKESEARDEIVAQLKALVKGGVTAREVERAQRKMAGEFEIGLQRNSAQAATMGFDELYGVGWDEHKEFVDKVMAVTPEDVLRVARKYIDVNSRVVSVVRGGG